jgi:hypothetical protein
MATTLLGSAQPLMTPIPKGEFQQTKLDRWSFVKRAGALRNEGNLWYPAWRDLAKYLNPTRGFFYETRPNTGYEIDHKTILDSTPEESIGILASGMVSGLTSPSRPWFRLSLPDPEALVVGHVKYWLDDVQNRMLDVFAKSNIYGGLSTIYEEIATFGTACGFLEEDPVDVIRMRVYTIGEYYLGTGPDGRVNAFYRRFWMNVGQLVKEFGIENCTMQVQTLFRNNQPDTWIRVNFLIEENDERIVQYKDYSNMAYRSVYWEDGAMMDSYLRIGGYEEMPTLTPRWATTTTADAYGRGPGWKMLGDAKMLQRLQRNKLIALDKVTNPPVQVDASVQGEANMLPGGITRFSSQLPNAGVKPAYQVNPDLQAIEATIQKTQDAIKRKSFADLFLMMIDAERGGTPITATEVMERQSEKLSILGPVLERLETELLNPLIDRTFGIMLRNNLIPPPPREIQGMELKVQYVSVLAQAQKMTGVTAMQQVLNYASNLATIQLNAQGAAVIDNIDFDENIQEYADMLGVPAKTMASPEMITQLRQARAAAQAKAQQQQDAATAAQTMAAGAKGAKDASGAELGKNSALDQLMAGMTGIPGSTK